MYTTEHCVKLKVNERINLLDLSYDIKKIGLIFLVLTTIAFGCQQRSNQEKVALADSLSNSKIDTSWTNFDAGEFRDENDRPKALDRFETIFAYEDKEENAKQRLGVTWVTSNSIEFRLITDNDLCGTDYWGNAENKFSNMDSESDEDENGNSYPSSEFVTDEQTYSIAIRISMDKDSAKINYTDRSGEDTDCVPTPNLILVKQDER